MSQHTNQNTIPKHFQTYQITGESTDVICEAVIKKYIADNVVDGLLLRTLEDFIGYASFDLIWNTISVGPGQYYIDLCLRDMSGLLLDRQTQIFTIMEE